jgi:hypothetical protein
MFAVVWCCRSSTLVIAKANIEQLAYRGWYVHGANSRWRNKVVPSGSSHLANRLSVTSGIRIVWSETLCLAYMHFIVYAIAHPVR